MIIWLASYPKSGNTWVRLFLESLIHSKNNKFDINNTKIRQFPLRKDFTDLKIDENNIKEFVSNCITCQDKINLDNSFKIFKTHNALWKAENHSFTNEDNTHGVIHIVRDPRNVVTSLKNHFNSKDYEEALNFMINDKQYIGSKFNKKDNFLPTIISSWSNHYNSWKKMKKNYLLIRYEDLLADTFNQFNKITDYLKKNLNLKFDTSLVENSIMNCDFKKLTDYENKHGFVEASKDKNGNVKKFFFLGPQNKWEEILDNKTRGSIEKSFKDEMQELKYL